MMNNRPMITASYVTIKGDNSLEMFNIQYIHPNKLAEPYVEISRDEFDILHFESSHSCNYYGYASSVGVEKTYGTYTAQYFYHVTQGYVLARLSQYFMREKDVPSDGGEFISKTFPNGGDGAGYEVRYFRIGCPHPKQERWHENPRMFEHKEGCHLSGGQWGYDSSG